MTENTTASGAADLPEFPGHPEPQIMMWNALEIVAIRKYGADMFRAGRLAASAPVAPAPQPAAPKKKPLPDLMMAAYHEAIGWNACVDAMNVAAAPKAAPGDALDEALRERDDAEDFIDELLDEVLGADRPEWSSAYNRYDAMNDVRERITALHKPAADKACGRFESVTAEPQPSPVAQEAQEPVASVHRDTLAMLNSGQVRPWDGGARLHPPSKARFDTAYAPLYAAPPTAPADRIDLHQALTDPENQPNQYGVQFLMHGAKMAFRIGNRQFCLDYEPDEPGEFEFMRDALISAFSIFTPDVKIAQQPDPAPPADSVLEDAARYRWLRDPASNVALVLDKRTGYVPADERFSGVGGYHTYEYRAGEELDAAIDAARKQGASHD